MPPATLETLPNGLRLVLAPDPNAESATFGLFLESGSRHEPAALGGISHFIEHMLFKGTATRTALEISRAIEGRGGNFNALTSEEGTCFYASMPYEFLSTAVDIVSDMYLNASIPDAEFERERRVIIEEIKMYDDDPSSVVDENLSAALFDGHALGRPVAGTPAKLMAMTPQTLRDYIKKAYAPSATVAVISGRFDPSSASALVRERFGSLPAGRPVKSSAFPASRAPKPSAEAKRDIQQLQLAAGFRTKGRDAADRYAYSLFDCMMGKSMSSRLFQSIREKRGLSYDVRSYLNLFRETGAWGVFMGLAPENEDKAMSVLEREFARAKSHKPSASELRRTKDFLEGSFRLGLESPRARLFYLGPCVINYGRIIPVAEMMAGFENVTPEQVMQAANEIIDDSARCISRVAPKDR